MYTALNGTIYLIRVVTRGAITPFDYDNKEYWSFRPGGKRPWLIRAITHDGRWWGDHHSHHQSGVELDEGSDRSIAAESHVLSSAPGDEKTNTTTRMQSPARAVLRG